MLSAFDDYPIHQTPDPLLVPSTGDNDFYERYWFNGYNKAGDFYIGVGAAVYPHLGIIDAGVSILIDGKQHAFHVSGRVGQQREMKVGPFTLEIVEPMKSCRVKVDDNETGMKCNLLFEGRTSCIEEPRHHSFRGIKRIMDTTRFTQFGRWSGSISYHGEQLEIAADDTWGTKDRSWGRRPIGGGDKREAPPDGKGGGGIFFLWAPTHFEDMCLHYQLFDDYMGRPMFQVGAILPTYDGPSSLPGIEDPDVQPMRNLEHQVLFEPNSRMAASGTSVSMKGAVDGELHEMSMEKIFTYRMKGIGYMHPEWAHGTWKGELAMASEQWDLATLDESAFENQHVQHLMKMTYGDRVGIGVLEQVAIGPYKPYGLEGMIS